MFSLRGFGRDAIIDFSDRDGDLIDLRGVAGSFADLVIVQVGREVEIRLGDDVIVLDANDARSLDAGDFVF